MKEWKNNLDIGEVCTVEELNKPPTTAHQAEMNEEQESPVRSNGISDPGAETETESGSSKPSTPTKQVGMNMWRIQSKLYTVKLPPWKKEICLLMKSHWPRVSIPYVALAPGHSFQCYICRNTTENE